MNEVKRMTFGSTFERRLVVANGIDFVWFAPKRGRWLVETLKGVGHHWNWDVRGLHLVKGAFDPKMIDVALYGHDAAATERLGENICGGVFGAGVLDGGIPLEAEGITIGREATLVVLLQNITCGQLMTPALAVICQCVER